MPIFFWKREQEIERLMNQYMSEVLTCLDVFKDCLFALFEDATSDQAADLVSQVEHAESRADHLRHQIEFEMYGKALMPDSRGDLLGLVEAIDRIPNWAEEVVYDIHLQRVVFPQHLLNQFQHLTEANVQCFHVLHEAVTALFADIDAVFQLTQDVDKIEGEIDGSERQLIRAVIASLAAALTVTLMTYLALPVSTSQAIVGAVLGIGLAVGMRSVNKRTLAHIVLGWIAILIVSGILSFAMITLFT
jgi:predicted phosphate transport protein (TIGR00153 family)